MSHLFKEYGPLKGEISNRDNGVLVAMESGISTAYALNNVQERGKLFIGPQEDVYEGMIVGENSRPDDLDCECLQDKASHQHAEPGRREGCAIGAPAADDSRAGAGIYRAGRIRRSDAENAAIAQKDPRFDDSKASLQQSKLTNQSICSLAMAIAC